MTHETTARKPGTPAKGSTNELPMVDLSTTLEFLQKLDVKGLETLSQAEVSKELGYSSHTSTPYYRRTLASKLFGLLDTNQGMVLTRLALDIFKPTHADAKQLALRAAVRNVLAYQKIIDRYLEKRPPGVEILTNHIEREHSLSREAARVCAMVFSDSLKTAGMIDGNGQIFHQTDSALKVSQSEEGPAASAQGSAINFSPAADFDKSLETHFLTLDRKTGRKVIMQGPSVISKAELERLQNWLAVQFEVVEALDGQEGGLQELS